MVIRTSRSTHRSGARTRARYASFSGLARTTTQGTIVRISGQLDALTATIPARQTLTSTLPANLLRRTSPPASPAILRIVECVRTNATALLRSVAIADATHTVLTGCTSFAARAAMLIVRGKVMARRRAAAKILRLALTRARPAGLRRITAGRTIIDETVAVIIQSVAILRCTRINAIVVIITVITAASGRRMTVLILIERIPDAKRTRRIATHILLAGIPRRTIGILCTHRAIQAALVGRAVRTGRTSRRTRIGSNRMRT